jgi:hypothetical protein
MNEDWSIAANQRGDADRDSTRLRNGFYDPDARIVTGQDDAAVLLPY